MKLVVLKL